jgi:hypothetical protein
MELTLSPETREFLGNELEEMLCHCDLSETQCDELGALLSFLDTPHADRLNLLK